MNNTKQEIENHNAICEENRALLPSGEWDKEPNRLNWKAHGLDCMAVRHPSSFHWCGYVGVPPGHPDSGKGYDDVDVEVHGGLTYAESCKGHICHIPAEGEEDHLHWFGFDCAHSGDLSPGIEYRVKAAKRMMKEGNVDGKRELQLLFENDNVLGDTYRTLEYVKEQTEELAKQIAERAA